MSYPLNIFRCNLLSIICIWGLALLFFFILPSPIQAANPNIYFGPIQTTLNGNYPEYNFKITLEVKKGVTPLATLTYQSQGDNCNANNTYGYCIPEKNITTDPNFLPNSVGPDDKIAIQVKKIEIIDQWGNFRTDPNSDTGTPITALIEGFGTSTQKPNRDPTTWIWTRSAGSHTGWITFWWWPQPQDPEFNLTTPMDPNVLGTKPYEARVLLKNPKTNKYKISLTKWGKFLGSAQGKDNTWNLGYEFEVNNCAKNICQIENRKYHGGLSYSSVEPSVESNSPDPGGNATILLTFKSWEKNSNYKISVYEVAENKPKAISFYIGTNPPPSSKVQLSPDILQPPTKGKAVKITVLGGTSDSYRIDSPDIQQISFFCTLDASNNCSQDVTLNTNLPGGIHTFKVYNQGTSSYLTDNLPLRVESSGGTGPECKINADCTVGDKKTCIAGVCVKAANSAGQICETDSGNIIPVGQPTPAPEKTGIMTAIGCIPTQPTPLIQNLIKVATAAGGGISLLLMIYGAFLWITSTGNPDSMKKAQDQFTNAAIGLLFIIFSIMILKIIGVDILQIPGFTK